MNRPRGGQTASVPALRPTGDDLSLAWQREDQFARWRSAAVLGPGAGAQESGASVLEVPRGCKLPRHTDSAEEIIVVTDGEAEVRVGDEVSHVAAGGLAFVPRCVPHEVRNAGNGVLRFVAVYASADVTTTYERPVQPGGDRERDPVG